MIRPKQDWNFVVVRAIQVYKEISDKGLLTQFATSGNIISQ